MIENLPKLLLGATTRLIIGHLAGRRKANTVGFCCRYRQRYQQSTPAPGDLFDGRESVLPISVCKCDDYD